MKVVHLSTSDMGGAGIAAKRLHLSMLDAGVESKFLTLYKYGPDIKQHYLVQEEARSMGGKLIKRLRSTLRYRLSFLYFDPGYYLKNRPSGYDHFSFPYSRIDLWRNKILREADLIHLHWVADGMLDYVKFFKKLKKPLVWTLHDMNPFTGGCHHSDGSMEFISDCLDCKQIKHTPDESMAAKARWFRGLSIEERMSVFVAFTRLILENNPEIAKKKHARPVSDHVRILTLEQK